MTTTTVTAALVRNQRLHLAVDGQIDRCAGRRVSPPLVSASVEAPDLPLGFERAAVMATARAEAKRQLAALVTTQIAAELCEKCAAPLAEAVTA